MNADMHSNGGDRPVAHSLRRSAFICGFFFVAGSVSAAPTYQDQVRPILKSNCFKCHNADKKKGDIDLTTYTGVLAGGSAGEIVVSGAPERSVLYQAMSHTGDAETMPPKKDALPEVELVVLREWIAGGLIDREGGAAKPAKAAVNLEVDPAAIGERPDGPPPMPQNLSPGAAPPVAHPPPVTAMAASPWAPLLAVSGHEAILLYDAGKLEYLGALPFPERTPHVLKFSRDGKLLLAAGGRGAHSGRVVVWDVETCERVAEVGDDEIDSVLAADISADRKYIALGGTDKILKVFEVSSGELVHRIKKHTDWVTALEFSPDGRSIASGDRNGGIHTWEAETGSIVFTLAEHKMRVTDISWRADGKFLASSAEDGRVITWEMEEGFPSRSSTPHKAGSDSKRERRRNRDYDGDAPGVLSIEFGDKGQLVSAGRDGSVRLLRSDLAPEAILDEFEEFPTAAVYLDQGALVATGDFRGKVRIWEVVRTKGKPKVTQLQTFSTRVQAAE